MKMLRESGAFLLCLTAVLQFLALDLYCRIGRGKNKRSETRGCSKIPSGAQLNTNRRMTGDVMTPDVVMGWVNVAAIAAGVAFGAFAVYSPSYVWLRKQVFGLGSVVLCGVGAVLIIGPIYRTVTVVANEKGLELRLDKLQAEIQKTANLASAAQQQVAKQQKTLDKVSASGTVSTTDFQQLQKQVEAVNGHLSTIARATDAALKGVQEVQTQTGTHPVSQSESNKARRQLTPYFAPAAKPGQSIGPVHD